MRLTIETPRLVLRPPEHRDAEAIARCVGDYDVARMTGLIPHPYTIEVAEGWIAFTNALQRRGAAYNFMMVAREDGEVCGCMGLFRRKPQSDWEVGYWVARPRWGRGYASEALAAVIAWARTELRPPRIVAGCFEDNPASGRVLEKAGFKPTGACPELYSIARGVKATSIDMVLELDAAERAA